MRSRPAERLSFALLILSAPAGTSLAQAPVPAPAASACWGHLAGFCIEDKINVSVLVTLALFAAGYAVTRWFAWYDKKKAQRNFYESLRVEIELIAKALAEPIANTDLEKLVQIVRGNPPRRPAWDARYSRTIFESNSDKLLSLPLDLLKEIVQFYDQLQAVEMMVQTVGKDIFLEITSDGREFLVRKIFEKSAEAKQKADHVASLLRRHIAPERDR
jgi:hypothetical protein